MHRKITDVIKGRDLVELPASASVYQATKLMREQLIGSVLVITDGQLQGIFTERDLVCRVVAEGLDPMQTGLEEVMTKNPDTIAPDRLALDGLRLMHDGGYRHLPVVADGRVVAVVSRRDFFGVEKARLEDETHMWQRL